MKIRRFRIRQRRGGKSISRFVCLSKTDKGVDYDKITTPSKTVPRLGVVIKTVKDKHDSSYSSALWSPVPLTVSRAASFSSKRTVSHWLILNTNPRKSYKEERVEKLQREITEIEHSTTLSDAIELKKLLAKKRAHLLRLTADVV